MLFIWRDRFQAWTKNIQSVKRTQFTMKINPPILFPNIYLYNIAIFRDLPYLKSRHMTWFSWFGDWVDTVFSRSIRQVNAIGHRSLVWEYQIMENGGIRSPFRTIKSLIIFDVWRLKEWHSTNITDKKWSFSFIYKIKQHAKLDFLSNISPYLCIWIFGIWLSPLFLRARSWLASCICGSSSRVYTSWTHCDYQKYPDW